MAQADCIITLANRLVIAWEAKQSPQVWVLAKRLDSHQQWAFLFTPRWECGQVQAGQAKTFGGAVDQTPAQS